MTGLIGDQAILAQLKLGDDDPLWASRLAARYVMLRGHGCTGEGCRKRVTGLILRRSGRAGVPGAETGG